MKPFLQGKKCHSAPPLRPPQPAGPAMGGPALRGSADPAAPAGGPTVEAIKEGDKVVRLIVTCTCGERIEVDCLYPPGA